MRKAFLVYRDFGIAHIVFNESDGEYICTCLSFLFRHRCRHIEMVKEYERGKREFGKYKIEMVVK